MAIGERIKFFRNLRGMTQKYLGQVIGFPEKTADVRLAQYETGTRTPKDDLTNLLASALGVSPMALDVPNIESYVGLMHTFFALEDLYGLKVRIIDGIPSLQIASDADANYETLSGLLKEWAEESDKLTIGKISKEQYDEWRYTYPEIPRERERAERDAAWDRLKHETK